jgi:putative transposase
VALNDNQDRKQPTAPDLVDRDFTASGPDELWAADTTYVPTNAGYLYLAVVLDAFSRRIVGWAMADHLRTELVLESLDMAAQKRGSKETIHHSDSGLSVHSDCLREAMQKTKASVHRWDW